MRTHAHSCALRRTIRRNPIAFTNWTCHQGQSDRLHQLDLSSGAIRSLVPIRLVRPVRAEPLPTHRLELIRNEKGDESEQAAFDEKESRESIGIERIVPKQAEGPDGRLGRDQAGLESLKEEAHLMREAIRGPRRSSEVIRGHQAGLESLEVEEHLKHLEGTQ